MKKFVKILTFFLLVVLISGMISIFASAGTEPDYSAIYNAPTASKTDDGSLSFGVAGESLLTAISGGATATYSAATNRATSPNYDGTLNTYKKIYKKDTTGGGNAGSIRLNVRGNVGTSSLRNYLTVSAKDEVWSNRTTVFDFDFMTDSVYINNLKLLFYVKSAEKQTRYNSENLMFTVSEDGTQQLVRQSDKAVFATFADDCCAWHHMTVVLYCGDKYAADGTTVQGLTDISYSYYLDGKLLLTADTWASDAAGTSLVDITADPIMQIYGLQIEIPTSLANNGQDFCLDNISIKTYNDTQTSGDTPVYTRTFTDAVAAAYAADVWDNTLPDSVIVVSGGAETNYQGITAALSAAKDGDEIYPTHDIGAISVDKKVTFYMDKTVVWSEYVEGSIDAQVRTGLTFAGNADSSAGIVMTKDTASSNKYDIYKFESSVRNATVYWWSSDKLEGEPIETEIALGDLGEGEAVTPEFSGEIAEQYVDGDLAYTFMGWYVAAINGNDYPLSELKLTIDNVGDRYDVYPKYEESAIVYIVDNGTDVIYRTDLASFASDVQTTGAVTITLCTDLDISALAPNVNSGNHYFSIKGDVTVDLNGNDLVFFALRSGYDAYFSLNATGSSMTVRNSSDDMANVYYAAAGSYNAEKGYTGAGTGLFCANCGDSEVKLIGAKNGVDNLTVYASALATMCAADGSRLNVTGGIYVLPASESGGNTGDCGFICVDSNGAQDAKEHKTFIEIDGATIVNAGGSRELFGAQTSSDDSAETNVDEALFTIADTTVVSGFSNYGCNVIGGGTTQENHSINTSLGIDFYFENCKIYGAITDSASAFVNVYLKNTALTDFSRTSAGIVAPDFSRFSFYDNAKGEYVDYDTAVESGVLKKLAAAEDTLKLNTVTLTSPTVEGVHADIAGKTALADKLAAAFNYELTKATLAEVTYNVKLGYTTLPESALAKIEWIYGGALKNTTFALPAEKALTYSTTFRILEGFVINTYNGTRAVDALAAGDTVQANINLISSETLVPGLMYNLSLDSSMSINLAIPKAAYESAGFTVTDGTNPLVGTPTVINGADYYLVTINCIDAISTTEAKTFVLKMGDAEEATVTLAVAGYAAQLLENGETDVEKELARAILQYALDAEKSLDKDDTDAIEKLTALLGTEVDTGVKNNSFGTVHNTDALANTELYGVFLRLDNNPGIVFQADEGKTVTFTVTYGSVTKTMEITKAGGEVVLDLKVYNFDTELTINVGGVDYSYNLATYLTGLCDLEEAGSAEDVLNEALANSIYNLVKAAQAYRAQ